MPSPSFVSEVRGPSGCLGVVIGQRSIAAAEHLEIVRAVDQLITNIMFYWAPNSVASSARLYWEMFHEDDHGMVKTAVPVAVAVFPKEEWMPPRHWLEALHDIVRWTEMSAGGHFHTFEQPDLMTGDLRALFRAYRGAIR